jgi:hypothetical protein
VGQLSYLFQVVVSVMLWGVPVHAADAPIVDPNYCMAFPSGNSGVTLIGESMDPVG